MEMLTRAASWMAESHDGDWTDHTPPLPYVIHVAEVVLNLQSIGGVGSEVQLCAAFLHDTVEHGGRTLVEVEKEFGSEVAGLVGELTRREPTLAECEGLDKEQIWQLRSDIMLAEIRSMSPNAQAIKLADRLSNLRMAIQSKKPKKLLRYKDQTRAILEIIPREVNPGLWRAIDRLLTS